VRKYEVFVNGDGKKTEVSTVHVKKGSAEVHSLNTSTLNIMKARFTSVA